jgi:hypothetical protein
VDRKIQDVKKSSQLLTKTKDAEVVAVDNQLGTDSMVQEGSRFPGSRRRQKKKCVDAKLWHARLGHLSWGTMEEMARKGMVRGLPSELRKDGDEKCDICCEMKSSRLPFYERSVKRADELLAVVHTDVCGPISPASVGGNRYFVSFTDDRSRKSDIYFMKRKSEVLDAFKLYRAKNEVETGKKIKVLRSDNGTEYVNQEMDALLQKWGIKHERTQVYSPEQNGLSERLNRTLTEKARCLLREANLPDRFWAEAIRAANYLRNRCRTRVIDGKVPLEVWSGRSPTVSFFRRFGCKAFVNIPKPQRNGKFDQRGRRCIFLGYCEGRKGYRLWDQQRKLIINSRDVVFDERTNGWNSQDEVASGESTDKLVITWDEDSGEVPFVAMKENIPEVNHISDANQQNEECVFSEEDEVAIETPVFSEPRQLRERTLKVKPTKYSAVSTGPGGNRSARRREKRRLMEEADLKTDSGTIGVIDIFSKYGP